jgi:hypothetical protein
LIIFSQGRFTVAIRAEVSGGFVVRAVIGIMKRLLTEVAERDDALKEIAMWIDHSWIPTEAEDDAALEDLRNQIIRNYPNTNSIDCPNESDLRRVVLGDFNEYSDSGRLM